MKGKGRGSQAGGTESVRHTVEGWLRGFWVSKDGSRRLSFGKAPQCARRARPFLTHTAVLEQVGPRIHLQWAAPSSGSAVFISHTHTHTHTHAGRAESGRGLGSVVSRVWHRVAPHK